MSQIHQVTLMVLELALRSLQLLVPLISPKLEPLSYYHLSKHFMTLFLFWLREL